MEANSFGQERTMNIAEELIARFAGTSYNVSIIQVYALTADSTEEELISFYLDGRIQDIPRKDILMLIGDWNAKVGSIIDSREATIRKYGYGKHNDRGQTLLPHLNLAPVLRMTPFEVC